MPAPTKPPCSGSWPEPPPETRPTLPDTGASARMTSWLARSTRTRPACAVAMPASASGTTVSGSLMNFLTTAACVLMVGAPPGRGADARPRARRGRGGPGARAPEPPKSVWLGVADDPDLPSLSTMPLACRSAPGQSSTMPNDFQDNSALPRSCQAGRSGRIPARSPCPGRRTRPASAAPCRRTSGTRRPSSRGGPRAVVGVAVQERRHHLAAQARAPPAHARGRRRHVACGQRDRAGQVQRPPLDPGDPRQGRDRLVGRHAHAGEQVAAAGHARGPRPARGPRCSRRTSTRLKRERTSVRRRPLA